MYLKLIHRNIKMEKAGGATPTAFPADSEEIERYG
jgi:hypothetical protein